MSKTWQGVLFAVALATAMPAQKQATARAHAEALLLFAQARAVAAGTVSVSQPEFYSYIAHQEQKAGDVPIARTSLDEAFAAAKALPSAGLALQIKREIEPDAVETLIEIGALADAERVGETADAARGEIADDLVGAETAAGRTAAAWRIWDNLSVRATRFPFRAAAALIAASPSDRARRRRLEARANAAAASVTTSAEAALAMDYLDSIASVGAERLESAVAARKLAAQLSTLRAPSWQIRSLYDRAAKLVASLDMEHPLPPFRFHPKTLARAAPGPSDLPRSPASDLVPFANAQQTRLAFDRVTSRINPLRPHPAERLTSRAAAAAPSIVARWARDYYCHGKAGDAHELMMRALDTVDTHVERPRAPDVIDYDGVPFWVYGLAAQIDFSLARSDAEELPAGWFKPLALAHVARMATAAAANRPGHCRPVLY